jgi:CRISPR associated protein
MSIVVTDPIIRIRSADDIIHVGLQDVFARADDGTLIDLPGMRTDQRAPVVTALAILAHLLRRFEREGVYTRYLIECLKGASVEHAKLTRFRLEQMSRPHRGASAPPSGVAQRVVPDAVLEGVLTVADPTVFIQTLMSGVGRQRAFGRGYVRLEPPRLSAAA